MSVPPSIPRPRTWPRNLAIVVGLLVALYFVLTSGAFLKAVVLPRVAATLKSDLTVGDLSVSPFSSVTLTDVKLTPPGGEPLATVKQVKARYSLWAILRGTIQVDEATVEGADITLVEKADGSSNLTRLLDALGKDEQPKDKTAPPKLAVRNVSLKNSAVHYRRTTATGKVETADVTGVNVTLDKLVNGETGKLTLAADARAQLAGPPASNLGVKLGGALDIALSDALLPQLVKGGLRVDLTEGTGSYQTFQGLGTALDIDLTATEVKALALRFTQGAQELARISVQGPLDLTKQEARLAYEVRGLDRRVLALVGAGSGLDLGATTVGATGRVDVVNAGNLIASNGRLTVSKFSVAGTGGRSPVLDIATDYKVALNQSEQSALVERLDLSVKDGVLELVKGALDRPMNLAWDKAAPGFRESTYSVKVAGLDLGQWKALLPSNAPTAVVRSELRVTAQKDGRMLRFTNETALDNLTGSVGGSSLQGASAIFRATGTATDLTAFSAESYSLEVRQGGNPLLSFSGVADWTTKTEQGGAQLTAEGQLPQLLALYPVAGVALKSGQVKLSGQATLKGADASAGVTVSLVGLNGSVGKAQLADYQATVDLAVAMQGSIIDVQRINVAAQSGYKAGGNFDVHGRFDRVKKSGTFDFKSVNLNESALGPFVAPSLAPNRLVSVTLDLNGKAEVDLEARSAVQLEVRVTNLKAEDPAKRLPATPMSLILALDAAQQGSLTEVSKLAVDLGATERAKNQLTLKALVDLGTNQPKPSTLTLSSDGLDLTRYYDLLAGDTAAVDGSTPAPAPAPKPAAKPETEPAALHLPLRDFTAQLDLAHVYLRELDLGALKGQILLKDDRLTIDPFGLTLNGAPVTAKVAANLGVPGYEYDVNVNAARFPLAPLINSFVTDLKGSAQGDALGQLQLKGAGVTAPNLRRNLGGLVLLVATNAQIKIPEKPIRLPGFLTWMPIFPNEINPAHVLFLIGKTAVLAEPIRTVQTRVDIAQGIAKVTETRVASPALLVEVTGDLKLADIMTNSTLNFPISLALASGGTLPAARNVGREVGILGKPEFEPDLRGLMAVVGAVNIPGIGNVGEKVGGLVQGIGSQLNQRTGGILNTAGNLLGGGASTNGAATNAATGGNLVGGVLRALGGGGAAANTNAPATSTNKPLNPLDLFKFGGKK